MKFDISDKKFSEFYSSIKPNIKELIKKSTRNKCYYCGKVCSSFQNSHSIPRFILGNLNSNNLYGNIFSLSNIEFMKGHTGINQAGSFYLLCEHCEKELFKYYEDKTVIENFNENDQKLLKSIALKNYLFQIYKAILNLSLIASGYKKCKKNDIPESLINGFRFNIGVNLSNLDTYEKVIQYDKHYFNKDIYKTISFIKLNYTVPIAMQTSFSIYKSINGVSLFYENTQVFEPYNLFIFPLKDSSIIALFGYKYSKNTDLLLEEFRLLSDSETLKLINYITFAFCEEYYVNESIVGSLRKTPQLKKLCLSMRKLDLSKYNSTNIPNILTE